MHLPHAVGYQHGPPKWWPLPVLAIGALIVALAITRLPGDGGHIPAKGLSAGGPSGVERRTGNSARGAGDDRVRAGARAGGPPDRVGAGVGGAGRSAWLAATRRRRRGCWSRPPGAFAAMSFIFSSPLIAAVILIEATAIGGPRLRLLLVPGLLAAGNRVARVARNRVVIGTEHDAYALRPLQLSALGHLAAGQFGWTIASRSPSRS